MHAFTPRMLLPGRGPALRDMNKLNRFVAQLRP
jgi:hypothetical protein